LNRPFRGGRRRRFPATRDTHFEISFETSSRRRRRRGREALQRPTFKTILRKQRPRQCYCPRRHP
jgi:hypothetical protein